MKTTLVNLIFFVDDKNILLAMKKRGFGEGKYNGVGGKVENGESTEDSMVREAQEEVGLTPLEYKKVAEILFGEYVKGKPEIVHMHVFMVTKWQGEPIESDEVVPKWFDKNRPPLQKMWVDDPYWLPQVIAGKKLVAKFKLNKGNELVSYNVKEVSKL